MGASLPNPNDQINPERPQQEDESFEDILQLLFRANVYFYERLLSPRPSDPLPTEHSNFRKEFYESLPESGRAQYEKLLGHAE